jgi:Tfp pilus assembly protein PilN
MFSDTELREATMHHTPMRVLTWLAWGLCAALFVLWIATITGWHLKDQLTEAAFLGDTRRDVLSAMQQVGTSLQQLQKEQQSLGQRLLAVEQRKSEPKPE